jgi:hypothetical protein
MWPFTQAAAGVFACYSTSYIQTTVDTLRGSLFTLSVRAHGNLSLLAAFCIVRHARQRLHERDRVDRYGLNP